MIGAEIAIGALVAAVVSAFCDAGGVLQKIRARRRARHVKNKDEESMQLTLSKAGPEIRQEYQYGVAQLGPRFEAGDSEWLSTSPLTSCL